MKHFYFAFYPKDFIAATVGMKAEEVGAYIRLLCYQFENGSIPIDDKETLTIIAGTGKIDKVLVKFPDGVNKKLSRVKEQGEYLQSIRGEAGSKGGSKTQAKRKQNSSNGGNINININSDIRDKDKDKETHTPPKAAVSTPQADFIANWGRLYEKATGLPYKHDKKDFILAAALIKKYSPAVVLDKARLLFGSCQGDGSLWFATGMGDFTVGKLSSKWNEIVPGKKKDKTQEIIEAGDRWEKKMKEAGL